jgi:hypothetical protein
MPEAFKLKPLAVGFVNYGFITRLESQNLPNYEGRMPGNIGVLLYKARSKNGPSSTKLDSKKNYNWQDRAVFPGSLPLPNGQIMMYYDDLNTPYLLRFTVSATGKDYTININVLREFGLIGSENFINENIQLPAITFSAESGDDFTLRDSFSIEQSPDCKSVFIMAMATFQNETHILGNAQRRNLAGIIRVDISGQVKKGLSDAGLTFNQSIFKTTAECSTQKTVEDITTVGQLTEEQQSVVAGEISDVSGKRTIERTIRYAYFDNNNNQHFYGFSAERTEYHLEVQGESGNEEVASPCFEDVSGIQLNGETVEERTTSSCNYYSQSETLPADDWIDEGLYTWNEDTISFIDPVYSVSGLFLYYKGVWQDAASGADKSWVYAAKDTNDDGEYDTCPQPSLFSSAGSYTWDNIADRFIRMSTFDPTASVQPEPIQLSTTVYSGYGTTNASDLSNSNLAYDHVNDQIREYRSYYNQGAFQQIPVGFETTAVFL